MTEAEWETSIDPQAMLKVIVGAAVVNGEPINLASDRKLRLFACACCRQVWHLLTDDVNCNRCTAPISGSPLFYTGKVQGKPCPDCGGSKRINRSRRAVEVAEKYADDRETLRAVEISLASEAHREATRGSIEEEDITAAALRCVSDGCVDPTDGHRFILTGILPHAEQAALLREVVGNPFRPVTLPPPCRTADVLALAQAAHSGDWPSLGPLSDALEEAGCDSGDLLAHLRSAGPHVKGCWAVDLLLGKS